MQTNKSDTPNARITPSKHAYGLIIFALVTLFNPNINVVDILPDFIGFLILAAFFDKGADASPYFDEAASGCRRLALISLLKIPAMIVITMARSKNSLDNDIIALMALTFSVMEIIFLLPAIRNTFSALFYLGERTNAEALIRNDRRFSAESLLSLTYIFFIYKCIIAALPECLRLTRTVNGSYVTGSNIYPYAVLLGGTIALFGGIVWLIRTIRYVRGIRDEGEFYDALSSMISSVGIKYHERKITRRAIFRIFTLCAIGTILMIKLKFDNFGDINLLPPMLSPIFFTVSALFLSKKSDIGRNLRPAVYAMGSLSVISATVAYVTEINFLTKYGFQKILYNADAEAVASYKTVIFTSLIQTALTIALLVVLALVMKGFIRYNIGISPDDENYMRADKRYHASLEKMTYTFVGISILALCAAFFEIYTNGNATLILTEGAYNSGTAIITSSIPWLGALVAFINIVNILYAFYYFSTLKDEITGVNL